MLASVTNLVKTDCDAARDLANEKFRLIEALKEFIVPLIQGSGGHGAGAITSSYTLTVEATNLLTALQQFVGSLAEKSASRKGALTSVDPLLSPAVVSKSGSASPQRPPLLKLLHERARYRVFNRMPIRMLMFNIDGTGIKLAERAEVLRTILEKIEKTYYTDRISKINQHSEEAPDAVDKFLDQHCAYAILSHTWLHESPGEVTFTDWIAKTFDPRLNGYRKLEMFCQVAALNHGLTLGWMDTCCIDKTSSAELDESIRSMFRWYESSAVCVTYLADTITLEEMHDDNWFTRGWTLQELIAPKMMKFYRKDWTRLASNRVKQNDKYNNAILEEIRKATTITKLELGRPMHKISISRRMQWAAERKVTKEEDTAYSLMGIFNVSFSTAYGEGAEEAFTRLVGEILKADQKGSDTLDIVNWGHGSDRQYRYSSASMLLPVSPKCYAHSVPNITWYSPCEPIISTPLGLRVSIIIMPALRSPFLQANDCVPRGDYYATANILGHFHANIQSFSRIANLDNPNQYGVYNVLDKRLFDTDGNLAFVRPKVASEISLIQIFGVLNFAETKTAVYFPSNKVCFALVLLTDEDTSAMHEKYWTAMQAIPTTFQLQTRGTTSNSVQILKSDLRKHGMTLATMYL